MKHYYAVFLCVVVGIVAAVCVTVWSGCGQAKWQKTDTTDDGYNQENMETAGKNVRKDNVTDKAEDVGENNGVKVAYLTFDDGPSPNTIKVLDILDKYNIKATFFMIGEQIEDGNAELVKSMYEKGHSIGIHTYCHEYNRIYCSESAYMEDFNKTRKILEDVLGVSPMIYRFPGGSCNVYIGCIKDRLIAGLSQEGYRYYDWNVSGEDSVGHPSVYSIYNNVVKDVCNFDNPIILLHDSAINANTVDALEDIITFIQGKGYTFDTLSE